VDPEVTFTLERIFQECTPTAVAVPVLPSPPSPPAGLLVLDDDFLLSLFTYLEPFDLFRLSVANQTLRGANCIT
jgi:hypothetical protein